MANTYEAWIRLLAECQFHWPEKMGARLPTNLFEVGDGRKVAFDGRWLPLQLVTLYENGTPLSGPVVQLEVVYDV